MRDLTLTDLIELLNQAYKRTDTAARVQFFVELDGQLAELQLSGLDVAIPLKSSSHGPSAVKLHFARREDE